MFQAVSAVLLLLTETVIETEKQKLYTEKPFNCQAGSTMSAPGM